MLARTLNAARPAFRIVDSLEERQEIDNELLYLASKHGDRMLAAQTRERQCYIAIERGDATALDEHIAVYGELADELRVAQHELGVTSLRALRAIIRGDFAHGRALVDDVEATRARWSIATPIGAAVDRVLELRCALSLATDDPAGIRALATQPMPHLRRQMFALFAAVRSSDAAVAATLYQGVVDRVLSPSSANFTFRSILAEAMVFLRDETRARQLYDLLGPYGGRHVIWTPAPVYGGSINRLRAGLALLAGDRDTAAAHFADAIRAEESFGARPFAERTRRERDAAIPDECGELIDERALRIKRAWGLTSRQLEVVLLVARGESNHAISAKLGCAERTVEVHITAVLRKAGVMSRTELAARFWTSS